MRAVVEIVEPLGSLPEPASSLLLNQCQNARESRSRCRGTAKSAEIKLAVGLRQAISRDGNSTNSTGVVRANQPRRCVNPVPRHQRYVGQIPRTVRGDSRPALP